MKLLFLQLKKQNNLNRMIKLNSGNIELLKLIAAFLMTIDHINKYLFNSTIVLFFELGRLSMPIFMFILAYNLAHKATFSRVINRLLICGIITTPVFIKLGGLYYGYYPLNIMFTLLVSVIVIYLIDKNIYLALLIFVLGGSCVEYWWPAISFTTFIFLFYRFKRNLFFLFAIISLIFLYYINVNFWALLSIPVIFILSCIKIKVPRLKMFFYIYYFAHLTVILFIKISMQQK